MEVQHRMEFLQKVCSSVIKILFQQISHVHWKSRKNCVKYSADFAFSFLGIRSKTKTWNWWKVYCNLFYCRLHFPNFKQRSSKAALVHMPSLEFGQDLFFVLKKEATTPIFHFKKAKTKQKKIRKMFLMYSNIDCKCLSINIFSVNIIEKVRKMS